MFKSTKMTIFVLLTLKIPVESTKIAVFVLSIWTKASLLFLRKEAFLDELFGDLDCVGGGTLAEVVGYAPVVETGLD